MSALRQTNPYTVADYLALEAQSNTKYEYANGEVFAMAGASRVHVRIQSRLMILLGMRLLHQPCTVLGSDQRVRVNPQRYTYPDITIACGELIYTDEKPESLLNPTVLVEVGSETTLAYDLNQKFWDATHIPSLQEYVVVMQDTAQVVSYRRHNDDQWLIAQTTGLEAMLTVESVGVQIPMRDIYDDVLNDVMSMDSPQE